ncbi:hypothetical protein SFC43_06900 [Bacteroides sp. CR5/BHMF/2]|nr:hypothetical protein [Bacteroides sp. CR5/BHMF/2]
MKEIPPCRRCRHGETELRSAQHRRHRESRGIETACGKYTGDAYNAIKKQLILATKMNGKLADENGTWHNAVLEIPNRVVGLGPLGGMAIYSIGEDYYQPEKNYHTCRTAIQTMNPSM